MVRELHDMDMRLMISVWSKINPKSEVGKQATEKGYYIPGSEWIDFFNPEAAAFYWSNFSERLLKPYQIDAWWQDATEPENDDLQNRRINNSQMPGELLRNVYPMYVNKTVYEGLHKDNPDKPHSSSPAAASQGCSDMPLPRGRAMWVTIGKRYAARLPEG